MRNGSYYNGQSGRPLFVKVTVEESAISVKDIESNADALKIPFSSVGQIQVFSGVVHITIKTETVPQTLEITDNTFLEELKKAYPTHPYFQDPHTVIFKMGKKGIIASLGAIVAILAAIYFLVIPGMIELSVNFFPKKYEIELGQKLKKEYLKHSEIDSTKTAYINDFYSSLKKNTQYPIHITVVKSEIVNAFALPGGEIVVYTGIIDSMKSYNELIGLLGHETGHVEYRHSLKSIFKNLFNYLVISILFQDYSGMMAVMIENASVVDRLAYNRTNEIESDDYGYAMVVENKGDPQGIENLFQTMLTRSGGDSLDVVPAFVLTHPKLKERIERVGKRRGEEKPISEQNESLRIKFQQVRDGIKYE